MPIWGLWKMSEPILKIEDLQVNYGGIEAVKGISFEVQEGQIVTLIGSNGAGKSSTLRTISGLVKPSGGKITFAGENITAAMKRVEGMMDKVVEGFEKQLDRLFENDAMDITTDVEVLERMLA